MSGATDDKSGDDRTMAELAQQALDIQDTSNLSGLVLSWARTMRRFNALNPGLSTDDRNHHPVHVLWADKMSSLTGAHSSQYLSECIEACQRLAQEPTEEPKSDT